MGQIVQMNGQKSTEIMETQSTFEVQTPNASYALVKATIDSQIATARAFPRSIAYAIQEVEELACKSPSVAKSCIYALPRGGKTIEGPSARLAEIVASCWGNLSVQGRVIDETDRFIVVTGECIDLQRNNRCTVEIRRPIIDRNGRMFTSDMIAVTANAAISIAIRNAVFKIVPRALWEDVYQKARETMIGKMKSIDEERADWIKFWEGEDISNERLFDALGVKGVEDISVGHIVRMTGWNNAINSGECGLEDVFPKPNKPSQKSEALTATLNAAKDKAAVKTVPKPEPKVEAKPQDLKWEREPGEDG